MLGNRGVVAPTRIWNMDTLRELGSKAHENRQCTRAAGRLERADARGGCLRPEDQRHDGPAERGITAHAEIGFGLLRCEQTAFRLAH